MTTSEGTCNERLARFVASESELTVSWLAGLGVSLTCCGARAVHSTIPCGIIKPLLEACKTRVEVMLNTRELNC